MPKSVPFLDRRVTIVEPPDGQKLTEPGAAQVIAQIDYPVPAEADRFQVKVFVNGAPLPTGAGFPLVGNRQTLALPLDALDPSNRVTVVVQEKTGGVIGQGVRGHGAPGDQVQGGPVQVEQDLLTA